ncbi:MAG: Wzy polymerase domain-containing protein [Burkholderiaceae bacterium]
MLPLTHSKIQRISVWFLCVALLVAWLLPYRTYPYGSFYNDYVSVLGVVCGLLCVCGTRSRDQIDIPACAWLPLAIAGWISCQALFAQLAYRTDAILPLGYLVAASGAAVLGATSRSANIRSLSDDFPHLLIASAILIAACLSAFISFFQYLGIDRLLGDWSVAIDGDGKTAVQPYANLGRPDQLALLLCWALAALWSLIQRRWLNGVSGCIFALVLLTSLAFTQSKIAWLIVPAFVALVAWANRRSWARRVPATMLVGLTLYFIAVVLLLPALTQFSGIATDGVDQHPTLNSVRMVMILQGFLIGVQHPLAGVGWLGFPAHQIVVASQFGETPFAMHAHNLIANLSAELGWIATAAILAATAYWLFINFVKTSTDARRHFALMVFVAVGVHSMFGLPLWYAYVLLPVFFIAGFVETTRKEARRIVVQRGPVLAIVLIGAAALALIASDYRGVVQGFRALGYERLGWTYAEGSTERPELTVFPQFYDYFAFADVRPTSGITPQQMVAYERVEKRFGSAAVMMRMAIIYGLNGRPDDAVATMDVMRHLDRQRYLEAYRAWEEMSRAGPDVLGKIYARLTPPS